MSDTHSEHTREALLAGVAVQAGHLADISEKLVRQLRMSKLERIFFVSMTLLILGVGVGLLFLGVSNRHNTTATNRTAATVLDCTQPTGKCYQRGKEQTAAAVAQLVHANLISSWCTGHSATLAQAQKCVIRLTRPRQ